ncbi:MAG: AAA family ATPase [bacterium]
MREKPVILVLGMPGSGKTTVGREIAEYLRIPFLSMGDVLRAGRLSGVLPETHDLATAFLELELLRLPGKYLGGLVLDFSPVHQSGNMWLEEMLGILGFKVSVVIYIRVKTSEAERRYISRGKRPGDSTNNMSQLFRQRVKNEFRPFSLPLIRKADKLRKLVVLNNCSDEMQRNEGVAAMGRIIIRKIDI